MFIKVLRIVQDSSRFLQAGYIRKCDIFTARNYITFTQEHQEMKNTINKIIESDINPFVDEWERNNMYPAKQVYKQLANAGLLGITRPEEYGGLGLDYSFSFAFLEELGNINCTGVSMSIALQTDMATPALTKFGSDGLKKEFLKPSITGDLVSSVGISEVHTGSDVSAISTKAEMRGGDLIINGGKMWITNGMQADWMCLLANTNNDSVYKNKSLICLPLNLPGISRTPISKLGTHSSDTAQIFFDNVRVPAKNIIGETGKGFQYLMAQLQDERMVPLALGPRFMKRCIQETINYCKERKTFGNPIIDYQYIQFTIAELLTEVEALEALIHKTVVAKMAGENITLLSSMAKLKTGRLHREVADKCLQFWGGMGYTADVRISRYFRDNRLASIAGGTDEIMLGIISKCAGLMSN